MNTVAENIKHIGKCTLSIIVEGHTAEIVEHIAPIGDSFKCRVKTYQGDVLTLILSGGAYCAKGHP